MRRTIRTTEFRTASRCRVPRLECLEDRTVLSIYSQIADDLDRTLVVMQNGISNALHKIDQVPFLSVPADNLKGTKFVNSFRQKLHDAIASLNNPTDTDIKQAVFGVLGNQGGLNLLGDLNNDGLSYNDV